MFVRVKWICFSLLCLVFTMVRAATVPTLTARVVDRANALSATERQRVEAALVSFEQATGGQLAILIDERIPEGEYLEGWTLKVAETWKLGHRGKDNGALLYLAMKDRRNRLEIGYGWEGLVNDARAGDVLRAMAPALRQGATEQALLLAIQSLNIIITGHPLQQLPIPPTQQSQEANPLHVIIILGIFGAFLYCFIRYPRFALFMMALFANSGRGGGTSGRGGFGGFSGGGGGFGGGGASGRW